MLKLVVNNDPEEEGVVIPAKPGEGGPRDGDWLTPMPSGTEFLVRDKTGHQPRWLVNEFTHGGLMRGNVMIIPTKTMQDIRTWFWVDPIEFCKAFEFRGIIEEE